MRAVSSGADALNVAHLTAPDLILLEAQMPGLTGFQVCAALKADEKLAEVPVIFITSHREQACELQGLELGAVDFIAKPINSALVVARVKIQLRAKRLADELRRQSMIDGLTGVGNRRRFDETLRREWLRARRNGESLSLLMVDVDHFKLFNDQYGHPAGDACLRTVASALVSTSQRPADLVARYGGEEFVQLLPKTGRAGAAHLAWRAFDAVAALGISHDGSPLGRRLTVSVGIGCYDEDSECWTGRWADCGFGHEHPELWAATTLVDAADAALYAAKEAGRGCVWLLDMAQAGIPAQAQAIERPPARPR